MTQTAVTPPLARRRRLSSAWLMAGLFALLLVLAALRPLALPDEGRYGEVGRWMAASGDWLVPRLNGLPFFHKPPLLYWLEAASVTLLGATAWALRLVAALHAALMMAVLFWTVRAFARLAGDAAGGERLARRAALMFGASLTFLIGGQFVNHDMLVASWISVAIWCFALAFLRADAARGKPHTALALAGFAACALGVLSKGLIGVALPGLVLFIWLLWTRQFGRLWRLPWLRGLLLFAVIAVPWFVLAGQRYPGMLNYMFGVQQFTRYTSGGFNNVQPWWFYLVCLVVLLFPWLFFALAEGVAQARSRSASSSPLPRQALSLCWIWVAAILAFFSIPQSKLIGYALPVIPPLALLAAAGWDRCMAGRRAALLWLMGLTALALVAACAVSVLAGNYASRSSARGVAQRLMHAAAPGDPVYAVGGFPYDLAFFARLQRPPIVVQDWPRQRAKAGDVWQRELFEAGDFDPVLAARVLQSPPAALQAARAAPRAWVVAPVNYKNSADLVGLHPVAQDGHWALYASPALAAALSSAVVAKSPEAAQ